MESPERTDDKEPSATIALAASGPTQFDRLSRERYNFKASILGSRVARTLFAEEHFRRALINEIARSRSYQNRALESSAGRKHR